MWMEKLKDFKIFFQGFKTTFFDPENAKMYQTCSVEKL